MGRHSRPRLHLRPPLSAAVPVVVRVAPMLLAAVAVSGASFAHTDQPDTSGVRSAPRDVAGAATPQGPSAAERAAEPTPHPQPVRERARLGGQRASRDAPRPALPGCPPEADLDHPNGQLPAHALCDLPGGATLRADAARAFVLLTARARRSLEARVCLSGGYRSYAAQAQLYASKPGLAAPPGSSNHGDGTALDLCGDAATEGTATHVWLDRAGSRFGWVHPAWARPGGSRPEPWHVEYIPDLDTSLGG